ncbi:cell wall-binding repeat-containing protein [Euzebya sp.]|uniref:cell wall-binding repeat-containing protein n=1 Tax=Euzebya sp. TaxID=1971409 RepID=UPI003511BDE5
MPRRAPAALLSLALLLTLLSLPASAQTGGLTTLTNESFTGTAVQNPGDWTAGGSPNPPCLTASSDAGASSIAACTTGTVDVDGAGALRLTRAVNNAAGYVLYNHALPTSGGLDITFQQAQYGGTGADGISLFVVDGETKLTAPGALGGWLGYGGSPTSPTDGVANGLFNVALDAWGNNSNRTFDGGSCAVPAPNTRELEGRNHVVVRGPGNGEVGYCFLDHAPAPIYAAARNTRSTAAVTVRIQVDPSTAPQRDIRVWVDGDLVIETPQPAQYRDADTFKFGFAASTGGSNNVHEVWGLDVESIVAVEAQPFVTVETADRQPPVAGATTTLIHRAGIRATGGPQGAPIVVTHDLPVGVTLAGTPSAGASWSCQGTTGDATVTCTTTPDPDNPLRPGTELPAISIPVDLDGSVPVGTDLADGLVIDGDGPRGDGTPALFARTVVTTRADLAIHQAAPASVPLSGIVDYGLQVTNHGPSTATDVVVTDELPAGVTAITAPGCDVTGQVVTCAVPNLPVGATHDLVASATAPGTPGTLRNAARVSGSAFDPVHANDTTAVAATTVEPHGDLAVTIDAPVVVTATQDLVIDVTVSNVGAQTAVGGQVEITTGALAITSAGGCTPSGTSATCPTGDLAAGQTATFTVAASTPDATTPAVVHATASTTGVDVDARNDHARREVRIQQAPTLTAVVTAPASAPLGGTIDYEIDVENAGTVVAEDVVISDDVPAGLSDPTTTSTGCAVTGGTHVDCTVGDLAAGADATAAWTATAPSTPTTVENDAQVTAALAGSQRTALTSTVVSAHADMSATLAAPGAVSLGADVTYVVGVENHGPNTAPQASVDLTLPAGMTDVVIPTGCTPHLGAIRCAVDDLVVGDEATWTITADAPSTEGDLTATAVAGTTAVDVVIHNDPSAPATTAVQRQADLAVAVTGPARMALDGSAIFTATVINHGPDDATTTELQTSVTGAAATTSSTTGCAGTPLRCDVGTLGVGQTAQAVLTTTAPSTPGFLVHQATASTAAVDLVADDDVATWTSTTGAVADLAVSLTAPAAVVRGGQVAFTVTVRNLGPQDAADVVVSGPIPAGLAAPTGAVPCTVAGGTFTCAVGTVAAGATWTGGLTATATTIGTLTASASATTSIRDADASNDTSGPVTTDVTAPPVVPGPSGGPTAPQPSPTPTPAPPVTAPPAPPGATDEDSDVSEDEDDDATATTGPLRGTGTGRGGVTVAHLPDTPTSPAPGAGEDDYYDVRTSPGHGFDTFELRLDDPDATALYWWDGEAWLKLQGTSVDPDTGELVVVITEDSRPSFGDLDDLQLAAGATPADRMAGQTRVGTAVAASRAAWPAEGTAGAVVLARDDVYADALTGGPLAVAESAPLLLTGRTALYPEIVEEIGRLLPAGGTVYLLGGTAALDEGVATAVEALGYVVVRVAGTDRYATAVAIAEHLGSPEVVFQATGTDFPDAMAAGPAAAASGGAVLLTAGDQQSPATAAYLASHGEATRYAVGGAAAAADPGATPLVGDDRVDTAALVAEAFFDQPGHVGVAPAGDFPDALVAAPVLGAHGDPLLLVSSGDLPARVRTYLTARSWTIGGVTVFGGSAALSDDVLTTLQRALP